MAKYCANCGNKLPFLSSQIICKECHIANQSQIANIEQQIITAKDITEKQIAFLNTFHTKQRKKYILDLYNNMYKAFEEDNELDEKEISVLKDIQDSFSLTNDEVKYDELIRPYIYVLSIRQENALPTVKLEIANSSNPILKKDEVINFASEAKLKEMRSVSLGYKGGSQGVSIRICKGVRYRVGSHRGHVVRETQLVDTSYGVFIITNQRLLLHPAPGNKAVSIPLKKIISFQCYDNYVEVYKEGREKGFFFAMDNPSIEISGICLGHLLQ
jgi:hypothetical protein